MILQFVVPAGIDTSKSGVVDQIIVLPSGWLTNNYFKDRAHWSSKQQHKYNAVSSCQLELGQEDKLCIHLEWFRNKWNRNKMEAAIITSQQQQFPV